MSKSHRTALVIDVSQGVTSEFKERYGRLLDSLNGNQIKVDIYHFDGSAVRAGAPSSYSTPASSSIQDWAAEAGYVQVLTSAPGK